MPLQGEGVGFPFFGCCLSRRRNGRRPLVSNLAPAAMISLKSLSFAEIQPNALSFQKKSVTLCRLVDRSAVLCASRKPATMTKRAFRAFILTFEIAKFKSQRMTVEATPPICFVCIRLPRRRARAYSAWGMLFPVHFGDGVWRYQKVDELGQVPALSCSQTHKPFRAMRGTESRQ